MRKCAEGCPSSDEHKSQLLKGGYIGDYIGDSYIEVTQGDPSIPLNKAYNTRLYNPLYNPPSRSSDYSSDSAPIKRPSAAQDSNLDP